MRLTVVGRISAEFSFPKSLWERNCRRNSSFASNSALFVDGNKVSGVIAFHPGAPGLERVRRAIFHIGFVIANGQKATLRADDVMKI